MHYTEILELLQKNSKKALEALYIQYMEKFYGYAVNKWHFSEDDAMNVIYQTLETLVLKMVNYKFESKAHFDNFVYKVFINFLRQQFRSNRKKNQEISFISLSEIELENDDYEINKVEQLENSFSSDAFNDYYGKDDNKNLTILQNALKKLDEFDKEILLLRAQNFSYEEIASMIGVKNTQLKVKYHRAKGKLLKLIGTELITKK